MSALSIAVAAAPFGRDLEQGFARIEALLAEARARGAGLLVLPEAALGGYLANLDDPDGGSLGFPPALDIDGPELDRLARLAGPTVVCAGLCEEVDGERFNSAVCVSGDGVLGHYRKVHLPLGEGQHTATGDELRAFDTPVGRLGMLICYDKAFPESARELALDEAEVIACLSAWPMSATDPAPRIEDDRQSRLFELLDRARAADNQLVFASANQTGEFGKLRFLGQAKIVGPGGEILAATGAEEGLAVASVDPPAMIAKARRKLDHLRDRRPDLYPLAQQEGVAAA
ncbi:MAG: carbon-nitrogen hydrolase family protein [Actinomycetota bacterium]|nr:carbon-nitrogen hydrolase family protein [Actinomycetota bacterium]